MSYARQTHILVCVDIETEMRKYKHTQKCYGWGARSEHFKDHPLGQINFERSKPEIHFSIL